MLLIVDNFAPVLSLYPDLEDFFITLTQQGGNYGIYVAITVNSAMNIGYKISQNVKNAIALQMTDRSDYAAIVGNTNGLEPEKAPGRGLAKCESIVEFQTALPANGNSDSERVAAIRALAEEMRSSWPGP